MSKFHNDDTSASSPGELEVSLEKLRALEPELFDTRTFKCSPQCPVDHPASEIRERIAEHLRIGDSQPAMVVSIDPLIVSVRSEDLDAAVLLRFPPTLASQFNLEVGTRLISVNTYREVTRRDGKTLLFAADLVPGPRWTGWSNVTPLIGDFLSDDQDRLRVLKKSVREIDWNRLQQSTTARLARGGAETARDGRPSRSGFPVPPDKRSSLFRPLAKAFDWKRLLGPVLAVVAGALAIYLLRK